jgi:ribosomal protein S18 acetylase RimI-like enzyme
MIQWLCFEWQTSGLPELSAPGAGIVIRAARKSDHEGVVKTLRSALSVDSAWGGMNRAVGARLARQTEEIFASDDPRCLVVVHGQHIVGVSLLDVAPDAPNHLLSGPCILQEYQNRGLASALLAASLDCLQKNQVKTARGITRANSLAARFVYPKFGGVSRPHNPRPPKPAAD